MDSVQSFFALAIGFAFAGCLTTGYQVATRRPANFRLLQRGPRRRRFAAVPFLVFAAPFIIMRGVLHGSRIDRASFSLVFAATVIAGFWSLMSGTAAIAMLTTVGLLGF